MIDISLPLHQHSIVWPGDPPVKKETLQGNCTYLGLSLRTGTHIMAPKCVDNKGKYVHELPIETFNGACKVITIPSSAPEISIEFIHKQHIQPGDKILFKTKNSQLIESGQFNSMYVHLSPESAQYLQDHQVSLIGLDYLSLDPYNNPGRSSEEILLSSQIPLLLGIYLDHILAGDYNLQCLPIAVHNSERAPCRAFLQKK